MGPLLKPNVCVALYSVLQKHVIRKTHFLLKPQEISEKFCIALKLCMNYRIYFFFSAFLYEQYGTLLWKLKTYLLSPLLCLFYFANHVL